MERFQVSDRSARKWLAVAYRGMAAEAAVERKQIVGTALRRRRLVMARAAKDGNWKTYRQAADSEAMLLGLNAPIQSEHHVDLTKVIPPGDLRRPSPLPRACDPPIQDRSDDHLVKTSPRRRDLSRRVRVLAADDHNVLASTSTGNKGLLLHVWSA